MPKKAQNLAIFGKYQTQFLFYSKTKKTIEFLIKFRIEMVYSNISVRAIFKELFAKNQFDWKLRQIWTIYLW